MVSLYSHKLVTKLNKLLTFSSYEIFTSTHWSVFYYDKKSV